MKRVLSHLRREVFYLALLLVGVVAGGYNNQARAAYVLTGTLPLSVAATVKAGEVVMVTVGPVPASSGTPVTLVAEGSYGLHIYQTTFHNGVAQFALSREETRQSGLVSLTARSDEAKGTASFVIEPGPSVEPLTPLVESRSIIADADHWSMTVLIPCDAFGNPVMEGTPVQVLALHPGNRLENKLLAVKNLLVWTRIYSGIRAGYTILVAKIGQIHSSEGTLLEVAGWPVPFGLSAGPQSLPADGRQLTSLRTDVIRDKFGNVMPDGTLITFVVDAPNGERSYIPAYTIDGIAEAPLQAPTEPGKLIVHATVLGVESRKFTLVFSADLVANILPTTLYKELANSVRRSVPNG